jgi:hypothetical protein
MRRDRGRLAWLFSVLAQLDEPHRAFALAEGEDALSSLARYAVTSAPEWNIVERPFWRTPFDFSLVLALTELEGHQAPRGSRGFWKEVFRSDGLSNWRGRTDEPLTARSLLDVIFGEPVGARDRWEVFALGQRFAGVDRDSPEAGLMLRGARRHPALAQMLDRIGVAAPALVLSLHRASDRVFARDETGVRGDLGLWQGALAIVERAALSGGLDPAGVTSALSRLAALSLDDPRGEIASWFLDAFVGTLASRPGAPPDAERLVLQVMSGQLTPAGQRREPSFAWEDLAYSFGAAASLVGRMEQARAAQESATVEDARTAWRIAAGSAIGDADRLVERLRVLQVPSDAPELARRLEKARADRNTSDVKREARRAAEAIVAAVLPALAYVPHLAVTDTPSLGADVAYRHEFVSSDDGPVARRARPWQLARGSANGAAGWRLQGSLLMLDLSLADWYLRRNGLPADSPPMLDEGDMTALAQVAALARSAGTPGLRAAEISDAIARGRAAAAAAPSIDALDRMLDEAGVDPWRRAALAMQAGAAGDAAGLLSVSEAWRLGGAKGAVSPHPAIDGGAHFGSPPRSLLLTEGRRSAGLIGASAVDAQLRVALFLQSRGLSDRLFGDVAAGVINDAIQGTHAERPDDFAAFTATVAALDDARMEEHLLALVSDGTLARPTERAH